MMKSVFLIIGFHFLFLTGTHQEEIVKADVCIKEYDLCRPGDNCCQGLNCIQDQCLQPCTQGIPCQGNVDCCGDSDCYQNYCDRRKYNPKHECELYKSLCWNGVCIKGTCKSVTPKTLGQQCNPITEPCSGDDLLTCVNRTCVSSCKLENEKCSNKNFFSLCCSTNFCSVHGQCVSCKMYGEKCKSDAECCLGADLYTSPNCIKGVCRIPCFPNGYKCHVSEDCCGEECTNGVCSKRCSREGLGCKTTSDCCQGKVCGEKNLCQKPDPCVKIGNKCSGPDDCCLSSCINHKCKQPCTEVGKICISNKECCDDGFCVRKSCRSKPCVKQGQKCGTNDDCCSNLCTNGKCEDTCLPDGNKCTKDKDCCSNTCNKGVCTTECLPSNGMCDSNDECCDKICASGKCAFKCAPAKGTCTTGADCCYTTNCIHGHCWKDCSPNGYDCINGGNCCSGKCVKNTCVK